MERFVTLSPGRADSIAINSRSLMTFFGAKMPSTLLEGGVGGVDVVV